MKTQSPLWPQMMLHYQEADMSLIESALKAHSHLPQRFADSAVDSVNTEIGNCQFFRITQPSTVESPDSCC